MHLFKCNWIYYSRMSIVCFRFSYDALTFWTYLPSKKICFFLSQLQRKILRKKKSSVYHVSLQLSSFSASSHEGIRAAAVDRRNIRFARSPRGATYFHVWNKVISLLLCASGVVWTVGFCLRGFRPIYSWANTKLLAHLALCSLKWEIWKQIICTNV